MRAQTSVIGVLLFSATVGAAEPQIGPAVNVAYRSPDGSLSLRLPNGWRGSETALGGVPIQVLQPASGADDRILVGTGPLTVSSMQELASLSVQVVTGQLLPGTRLSAEPRYVQTSLGPAVELHYDLSGQSAWFHMVVMLK